MRGHVADGIKKLLAPPARKVHKAQLPFVRKTGQERFIVLPLWAAGATKSAGSGNDRTARQPGKYLPRVVPPSLHAGGCCKLRRFSENESGVLLALFVRMIICPVIVGVFAGSVVRGPVDNPLQLETNVLTHPGEYFMRPDHALIDGCIAYHNAAVATRREHVKHFLIDV